MVDAFNSTELLAIPCNTDHVSQADLSADYFDYRILPVLTC